jgi:hypothetical protein
LPDVTGFSALTKVQGEICAALTQKPLNSDQTEILAIYWRAKKNGEEPISVWTVASRMDAVGTRADVSKENLVRGALRSFGRRLAGGLDRMREELDHLGPAVQEIPLLAMMVIYKFPGGNQAHQLTDDGFAAVTAALGMTEDGTPAGGISKEGDDPDEIVMVGMTRMSAALLMRVQQGLGLGLDATVKTLTAQAGAG